MLELSLVGHISEAFKRIDLYHIGCRLCFKHNLFAGKCINALARFFGWLLYSGYLNQAGENKFAHCAFFHMASNEET